MRRFDPQPQPLEPLLHSLELKAVLVVDDDQQLASALQWILADENFLVDVAFDGEQAMMKVKAHEYDVVICDLKMPKLRGDEFYLKAKDLRPSLPIGSYSSPVSRPIRRSRSSSTSTK
jgi:DNA-binding NtrC family response regulator